MLLTLRHATADDAATLADIYFSAFSADEISLLCFPRGTKATWNWWHASILEEIQDPSSHFLCIYDADSSQKEIVSYAKWNDTSAPLATTNDLPQWPEGCDIKSRESFLRHIDRKEEGNHGGEETLVFGDHSNEARVAGKRSGGEVNEMGIGEGGCGWEGGGDVFGGESCREGGL